jgi:hypothetical protein
MAELVIQDGKDYTENRLDHYDDNDEIVGKMFYGARFGFWFFLVFHYFCVVARVDY